MKTAKKLRDSAEINRFRFTIRALVAKIEIEYEVTVKSHSHSAAVEMLGLLVKRPFEIMQTKKLKNYAYKKAALTVTTPV